MAELQWNEHIKIVTRQMSWRQQLNSAKAYWFFARNEAVDLDDLERQVRIVTLLIEHAPITVYRDGELLAAGTHDIGNGHTITLPLNREGMEADTFPSAVASFLVKAVQEENYHVLENFMEGTMVTLKLNEPSSAGGR